MRRPQYVPPDQRVAACPSHSVCFPLDGGRHGPRHYYVPKKNRLSVTILLVLVGSAGPTSFVALGRKHALLPQGRRLVGTGGWLRTRASGSLWPAMPVLLRRS